MHRFALIHKVGELCDVSKVTAEHGSHVFCRISGLEGMRSGRLPGIACGVALVEGV